MKGGFYLKKLSILALNNTYLLRKSPHDSSKYDKSSFFSTAANVSSSGMPLMLCRRIPYHTCLDCTQIPETRPYKSQRKRVAMGEQYTVSADDIARVGTGDSMPVEIRSVSISRIPNVTAMLPDDLLELVKHSTVAQAQNRLVKSQTLESYTNSPLRPNRKNPTQRKMPKPLQGQHVPELATRPPPSSVMDKKSLLPCRFQNFCFPSST